MAYRAGHGKPMRCTDGKRTWLVSGYRRRWPIKKPHIYWCPVRNRFIIRYYTRVDQRIRTMQCEYRHTAFFIARTMWKIHYVKT
jgi:hypothetical protein